MGMCGGGCDNKIQNVTLTHYVDRMCGWGASHMAHTLTGLSDSRLVYTQNSACIVTHQNKAGKKCVIAFNLNLKSCFDDLRISKSLDDRARHM